MGSVGGISVVVYECLEKRPKTDAARCSARMGSDGLSNVGTWLTTVKTSSPALVKALAFVPQQLLEVKVT